MIGSSWLGPGLSLQAANQNIEVKVCYPPASPSITSPADGTTTDESSIVVAGLAPADEVVYAIRNSVEVGFVTAAGDGSYAISVSLEVGDNTITTQTRNVCDNAADSPPIIINRTAPPPTPPPPTEPPSPSPEPEPTSPGTSEPPLSEPGAPPTAGIEIDILEPSDGLRTVSSVILVRGQTSPLTTVQLWLNDQQVAQVLSDEEGRFSVSVELSAGANQLFAVAGERPSAVTSDVITVHYLPTPLESAIISNSQATTALLLALGVVGLGLVWMFTHAIIGKRLRGSRGEEWP